MEQSGTRKKKNTRKVVSWLELPIARMEGPSKKKTKNKKTKNISLHGTVRANICWMSVHGRHRCFDMYWLSEPHTVRCKEYHLLTFYTQGKRGKQRLGILPQVTRLQVEDSVFKPSLSPATMILTMLESLVYGTELVWVLHKNLQTQRRFY